MRSLCGLHAVLENSIIDLLINHTCCLILKTIINVKDGNLKMYSKINIFWLVLSISICVNHSKATIGQKNIKNTDLIIFSFNRPMQLYAVLECTHKYFANLNNTYVLYRTSSQSYENAYDEIKIIFNQVHFVKQGNNPRADFKPLLLQCFFDSPAEYIMFSVDDDIVRDFVDIAECIDAMEKFDAYGFYLKLGENIIYAVWV